MTTEPDSDKQRPWKSKQSWMSGTASFLDGMSRSVILPYGPCLVNRLLTGEAHKLGLQDVGRVPLPYAMVVTAYLLGKGFGGTCASHFTISKENLPRIVARFSGMSISFYVVTVGWNIQSIAWLVLVRFVSAGLVGALCSITTEEEQHQHRCRLNSFQDVEEGLGDVGSKGKNIANESNSSLEFVSTIKIYLTSFAASILLGGLSYRHFLEGAAFQAITKKWQFSVSTIFLLALAIIVESMVRWFLHSISCHDAAPSHHHKEILYNNWGVSPVSSPSKGTFNRTQSANSDVFTPARQRFDSVGSVRARTSSHHMPVSRGRFETGDSDFFDCQSVLSDMEDLHDGDGENDVHTWKDALPAEVTNAIAEYRDRRVVYANGSPAHVPGGDSPDVVPSNYLTLCAGNKSKAEKMWQATQRWRREQNVWKIHRLPNLWFAEIKKAYPHFVHGYSKEGFPIIYEQPGKMNLKQMFREGAEVADMVRHYIFFLEYISNYICTSEEIRSKIGPTSLPHNSSSWGIMVVMDVKGAGLSVLSGDVLTYLKRAGDINNSHYPMSLKRAFAINSPFWLAGAWSSIKGILPDSVQVDLLSSHQYLAALRERIDDEQIPPEYGGSSPYKLGEHPFEKDLHDLVELANTTSPEENELDDADEMQTPIDKAPQDATYSFDYDRNSWQSDVDSSTIKDTAPHFATGDWRGSISMHSHTPGTRRRRAVSQDAGTSLKLGSSFVTDDVSDDDYRKKATAGLGGEGEVFIIVSCIRVFWMAAQGILETTIPLWILTPTEYGGLGYAPSRSAVALFDCMVVLLCAMRTKVSTLLSKHPNMAPLRSFRIAAGSQAVIILLLAILPKRVGPDQRTDSVFVMTVTIIFLACIALSSIFGHSSSSVLHQVASINFTKGEYTSNHLLSRWYGSSRLMSDCESGNLTHKISSIAEVLGVLVAGSIHAWSVSQDRPTPFDGTSCLFLSSLVSFFLYVCSFSLHLNVVGEFAVHPKEQHGGGNDRSDSGVRRCGSFLYEVVTVSVSDMASLFDEANWSTSAALGRQGSGCSSSTEANEL